jgi:uncharacterized protein with von Willebrand factor type A (vWA) domain
VTDPADLAGFAAALAAACREAGLPVGPDRAERFARAVAVVAPATPARLRHCAAATLVSGPEQVAVLDRLFAGMSQPEVADDASRGDLNAPGPVTSDPRPGPGAGGALRTGGGDSGGADRDAGVPVAAAAVERLADREFEALTPAELALLTEAMRALRVALPQRRSRRTRPAAHGDRVDLRATLRSAARRAGDPATLARRTARRRPRRLVVLCDISGSMEPYARALIQLLYSAAGVERAEVFTFATRLTRLTRALARTSPAVALERAGRLAPDWSGGTRIGEALRHFNDGYGRTGVARGAVVLILSDGWDTGGPELVGREMARLRAVAHRVVWANPRTRLEGYEPLAGGMAAAWPYCDAVVSAHSLEAMDELLAALAG